LAQDNREDQFTSYFGMLIALGSWAMLFIALFASYGIIRVQAENWVSPASDPSSLLLAAINTGIILMSSWTYYRGYRAILSGNLYSLKNWLVITIIVGAGFLVMQLNLWQLLTRRGFTATSLIEGSVFYMLSGLHGIHIIGGLAAVVWLLWKVTRQAINTPGQSLPVRLVGLFWHFLTVVWIALFIAVFII
jgi:cytochrome c oxidase subunit 3|tara:strand:- start:29 stop:601 length:573 start_codon:yes stop_codon:yes gene_type:complete